MSDVSLKEIILNPDSSLEIKNLRFERQSTVRFNFNYDYEMPFLVINDSLSNYNLKSIIMNYSRIHHSQYKPSFERYLNKPRIFLKMSNSKCSYFDNLFSFQSDFLDFNDQKKVNLICTENNGFIQFSLNLISMPSLKLSQKVTLADQVVQEPLVPPFLYIPTVSPTPKENDMTAAIVGGSVGGVAFIGIIAFVVYFIVSGRREDEALLNSMERKNARGEGEEMESAIESGIGASVDDSLEKKSDVSGDLEKVDNENKDNMFKDDINEKP